MYFLQATLSYFLSGKGPTSSYSSLKISLISLKWMVQFVKPDHLEKATTTKSLLKVPYSDHTSQLDNNKLAIRQDTRATMMDKSMKDGSKSKLFMSFILCQGYCKVDTLPPTNKWANEGSANLNTRDTVVACVLASLYCTWVCRYVGWSEITMYYQCAG